MDEEVQAAGAGSGHGWTTSQTGCGRGRRERGWHGVWLMVGGQAASEHSNIVACIIKFLKFDISSHTFSIIIYIITLLM